MYDVIILGSGPAGLTAALYCARAGKRTLVLGGDKLGGQTAGIAILENYPGWAGSGLELSKFIKNQATSFGAEIILASAKSVTANQKQGIGFTVVADNAAEYESRAVIASTGASPRKLEIAGARELFGRGVSYCATCDGFFYNGKSVLVIGGGNSALNDALYLADLAETVKIVYRKDSFARAEQVMVDRVNERSNIECLFNTELASLALKPDSADGELIATTTSGDTIACDGVFVAIGHEANTDYLPEDIKRDDMGRLAQSELPPGLFVAGDVQSDLKMQIATAVGTGCSAAMDAIAFINTSSE
ncbi:MAG: FAD-dependent oxidoreductase [Rickettsiales bacterium]|jgi:thioredoxin reductase (NADPH)|nr:FAD-dependent oxidoreductase [Rickettsiales bacterium]